MAQFPDVTSVPYENPIKESIRFKTLVSSFDELGEAQTRQKWLYPKRDVTLKYKHISLSEAQTIWQFYIARRGRYQAFNFFYPTGWEKAYVGEYVGTGDASTVNFNLPSKLASSYTLYVDGVAKTGGGVDYTFSAEGGTDQADKVTFIAAPAAGAYITWSFTGRLKIRARFDEDIFDYETFYARLVNTGITLQGILNA